MVENLSWFRPAIGQAVLNPQFAIVVDSLHCVANQAKTELRSMSTL